MRVSPLLGYGDLSSERVFARPEGHLSGRRENEFAIEADLKAYVTDHTGKNGILSQIVHRNGALLARTLAAGFWGGLSEALGGQPAPQVITAGTGDQQYLNTFNSDSAQYGVAQGASKALENCLITTCPCKPSLPCGQRSCGNQSQHHRDRRLRAESRRALGGRG